MKVFCILLSCVTIAYAVRFENCGGIAKIDMVNDIKITGCDRRASSCFFKRNTNADMLIEFAPQSEVKNLRAVVYGIMLLRIPFPIPNENACHNSGIQCPLRPNKLVSYRAQLPVRRNYPRIPVRVEWQLVDETGRKQVCIRFRARIV